MSEPKYGGCCRLAEVIGVSRYSTNRFLLREEYNPQDLFREIKEHLNLIGGVLSADDTVIEKLDSDLEKTQLLGYYWSEKYKKAIKGINLITLYYSDPEGISMPINYRLYDPLDKKTNFCQCATPMFIEIVLNRVVVLLKKGQRCFRRFFRRQTNSTQLEKLKLELLEESTLDLSYLILIIGSCVIATLGLVSNSAAVIIGAMIVAPLMLPIRGLAFGALEGDLILFRRGLISVTVGTLLALTLAWLLGSLAGIPTFGSEILARSKPNLLDLGIAIAAGSISGYAKVRPKISGSLAGTAIAVALMPPICVIGLGLAHASWFLSLGALLLYLTNLLGITLSCMIAFLLTGYAPFTEAHRALVSATVLTSFLLIPLSVSFIDLVRQTRLETNLRQALLNRTLTFQRVDLVKTETNWLVNPPEVRLTVRSQDGITPKQVELLEEFVAKAMGQPFTLIFESSQFTEVRREEHYPREMSGREIVNDPSIKNPVQFSQFSLKPDHLQKD